MYTVQYMHTIYHESFEAEKFCGLCNYLHVRETSLYGNLRWRCWNMDLRDSRVSHWYSSFLRRSACATCCETFLPWNFHGIRYVQAKACCLSDHIMSSGQSWMWLQQHQMSTHWHRNNKWMSPWHLQSIWSHKKHGVILKWSTCTVYAMQYIDEFSWYKNSLFIAS